MKRRVEESMSLIRGETWRICKMRKIARMTRAAQSTERLNTVSILISSISFPESYLKGHKKLALRTFIKISHTALLLTKSK